MSEADTADALQGQIEEAQRSGDVERANELYRRQIGTEGLEQLPVPAVVEGEGEGERDDPPADGAGELVVATNAEDETVAISGGMDFPGNPEHTAHALACMEVWGEDEVAQLKAKWGSDMGANLGYFQAFALAHPDVHELLVASGFGDHPAIIEAGATLGRRYVTKAGDPSRMTTRKAGVTAVDNMATNQIEARIDTLQDDIDAALAKNDHSKAQRLFTTQQSLYRRLPGGTDPVVGGSGRTS